MISFVRRLFNTLYDTVILTTSNVDDWPHFQKLLDSEKIVADSDGRLRYPHGAPVGRMKITGINSKGLPVYKEAADEWCDPDSLIAANFET